MSISFKGGVAIADAGLGVVWLPALAAMALGGLILLWPHPVLRNTVHHGPVAAG